MIYTYMDPGWFGKIYRHFPLNAAMFHLMYENNSYMDHLGRDPLY